jgi:hypothetical protein
MDKSLKTTKHPSFPSFIIDEAPLENEILNFPGEPNENDLVTILGKLIIPEKKDTQPVYRLSHQKANEIEELLVSMLPVLDSFENLLKLAEQFADQEVVQNWMKSMEAIYKRLKIVLSKQGLQSIESIGTLVDFTVHEVVEYRNIPDGILNLIIEEKQKGYKYKGKIIREARVVVANAEGG